MKSKIRPIRLVKTDLVIALFIRFNEAGSEGQAQVSFLCVCRHLMQSRLGFRPVKIGPVPAQRPFGREQNVHLRRNGPVDGRKNLFGIGLDIGLHRHLSTAYTDSRHKVLHIGVRSTQLLDKPRLVVSPTKARVQCLNMDLSAR